jgi:hypothetical protein
MLLERVREAAMQLCEHGCLAVDQAESCRPRSATAVVDWTAYAGEVRRESEDEIGQLSSMVVECDSRGVVCWTRRLSTSADRRWEIVRGRVQLRK